MPFINPGEPTKEIYEFHNGVKTCRRDPAVVWRRINSACVKQGDDGVPGETWDALHRRWALCAYSPNDTTDIQITKLADYLVLQGTLTAVAREAFDLQPIDDDGNGVNEEFVMNVLLDFINGREKKEPSIAISPSVSPPTDGGQAITSSASGSVGARGARRTSMGSRSTPRSATPLR